MAEIVRMPKMSDTMTEGVVAKWHKKIGDNIKSGELVAEIETDKATMEFESYQNGTLLYIGVPEGKAAPVDGILAIIGEAGEDYKPLLDKESSEKKETGEKKPDEKEPPQEKSAAKEPAQAKAGEKKENGRQQPQNTPSTEVKSAPESKPQIEKPAVKEVQETVDKDKVKASPLARRLADEKGINLSMLKGSGDGGRVIKRDIDWYKPSGYVSGNGFATPAVMEEGFDEIQLSQMRKTIAKRLSESKFTSPHFYLTMDIDMEDTMKARESINQVTGLKISFNDFVIKAASSALRQHPGVNSSWLGDVIRTNQHIHIGVAVAVDEGLLVPVVKFADSKSLSQINAEVKYYAQRAREKKLQPSDWEGNTFTISNLGMFDIEEFTAIINPPDACILAVGAIKETPVSKNGIIKPGHVMRVTLSCDHRVVDGVTGAKFLQTFKGLLENPVVLLSQASI